MPAAYPQQTAQANRRVIDHRIDELRIQQRSFESALRSGRGTPQQNKHWEEEVRDRKREIDQLRHS